MRLNRTCRPTREYREVDRLDNHVAGALNPYGARAWGLLREAGQPHERSAARSDIEPQARKSVQL
jgi:hypothetical protein